MHSSVCPREVIGQADIKLVGAGAILEWRCPEFLEERHFVVGPKRRNERNDEPTDEELKAFSWSVGLDQLKDKNVPHNDLCSRGCARCRSGH
jgi:hypothetical protein